MIRETDELKDWLKSFKKKKDRIKRRRNISQSNV